jgi:hypothetical protein
MCNKNLSAPQRNFETSIFLWKSRHHLFILGRLAGGSDTKLIGQHKLSAWFWHLPEGRGFISTENQKWVRKIQKPAAALIKAKICHFSSTFLKSISWDSPFKPTIPGFPYNLLPVAKTETVCCGSYFLMDPHSLALLDPDSDSIDFSTLILNRNFSKMLPIVPT